MQLRAVYRQLLADSLDLLTYGVDHRFVVQVCQDVGAKKVQLSFNFLEVNSGRVSDNSIAAAAYFVQRAEELGLVCELFFVDAPLRLRMDTARRKFLG